jgi:hypothetical protein
VRKVLVIGVLALLVAPAAFAGNGNLKVRPLDPAQAQTLAGTPGHPLPTTVTAISKADALSAMTAPDAATTLSAGFSSVAQAIAASTGCASWQSGYGWGTWPYDQEVYDHTYYCAVSGDHITSRSTRVTVGGTLCGAESRDNWVTTGGIGYFWMVVHAEARFSCPTVIPYITLHPTDWLETSYNAWGNASQVGHS